ncbi:MAG TPA: isochorismatase family cysteine hydrolase [Albitalea sp.]
MPRTPLANGTAAGATALVIIDMISSWHFADAGRLRPQAARIAPAIAALKARCLRAGVPAIYANDNHGMWRSDFRHVVEDSLAQGGPGARITEQLAPGEDDYFVLKPKHSAFFATPMHLLLQHLKVRRLLVTGVASDQCVLSTVADARMRDFDVVVPSDCVATHSAARNRRAVRHFEEALVVPTTPGPRIRLPARE